MQFIPGGAVAMIMHSCEFQRRQRLDEIDLLAGDAATRRQRLGGHLRLRLRRQLGLHDPGMLRVGPNRSYMLTQIRNVNPGDMPDFDARSADLLRRPHKNQRRSEALHHSQRWRPQPAASGAGGRSSARRASRFRRSLSTRTTASAAHHQSHGDDRQAARRARLHRDAPEPDSQHLPEGSRHGVALGDHRRNVQRRTRARPARSSKASAARRRCWAMSARRSSRPPKTC